MKFYDRMTKGDSSTFLTALASWLSGIDSSNISRQPSQKNKKYQKRESGG